MSTNVSELVIRALVRDEMSAPLQRIDGEVRRIDKDARSASVGVQRLSMSTDTLGRSVSRASGHLNTFVTRLGHLAVRGAAGLGFLTASAEVFGLKAAGSFEQSRMAFGTLLGSVAQGNALFKQLQDFADVTPFDTAGVSKAAQQLLGYGFAAQQLIPTLTAVGDAASGLGLGSGGLDQITRAIGQIQTKGRVQGDELLQLSEAGLPGLKILANQFGVTTEAMQAMISAGNMPAAKAIPALLAGIEHGTNGVNGSTVAFGGAMETQSKTLFGMLSTFRDRASRALASASQPVADALKRQMTPLTDAFTGLLTKAMPAINRVLVGLIDRAPAALAALTPVVTRMSLGFESLTKHLGPQVPVIMQMFTDLGPVMKDLVHVALAMVPIIDRLAVAFHDLLSLPGAPGGLAAVVVALFAFNKLSGPIKLIGALSGAVRGLATQFRGLALAETQAATAGTLGTVGGGKVGGGKVGKGLALGAGMLSGFLNDTSGGRARSMTNVASGILGSAGAGALGGGLIAGPYGAIIGGVGAGVVAAGRSIYADVTGDGNHGIPKSQIWDPKTPGYGGYDQAHHIDNSISGNTINVINPTSDVDVQRAIEAYQRDRAARK